MTPRARALLLWSVALLSAGIAAAQLAVHVRGGEPRLVFAGPSYQCSINACENQFAATEIVAVTALFACAVLAVAGQLTRSRRLLFSAAALPLLAVFALVADQWLMVRQTGSTFEPGLLQFIVPILLALCLAGPLVLAARVGASSSGASR